MITSKPTICEPLKDKVLLCDRIRDVAPRRVLVIFWHGVGDLVMFLPVFWALEKHYPMIEFKLGVPKGLTYLDLVPDAIELTGDEVNKDEQTELLGFDLVAKITFPMNEGQNEYTKGEFCCKHEIGINPIWGHGALPHYESRLCAVHFQITCLPESCNPDAATAERIWNDVRDAGWVPLEVHFQHIFHNPVNTMFPFIDATVRRCRPEIKTLAGLIQHAGAFVGVVSGPFHVAMSVLPAKRVLLLEKDFKREHFTRTDIRTANLLDYKNEVAAFLKEIG